MMEYADRPKVSHDELVAYDDAKYPAGMYGTGPRLRVFHFGMD